MRLGLAQINTIVGDLAGNRRRILDAYRTLVSQGAELVVFPELVVCGYPPRDLLFKSRFVTDVEQTTREIAAEIGAVPAIIGYTEANTTGQGRPAFNSAAFCLDGKILASARKCLLPTYDGGGGGWSGGVASMKTDTSSPPPNRLWSSSRVNASASPFAKTCGLTP